MMNKTNGNSSRYLGPLLIVMSLMFFWNLSRNINDVLIPHLKRACQLTDLQSSLIQSAFFGAYFLMALPAGRFIEKRGYKTGMITGLVLAAIGAAIFYPAAITRFYPVFLLALFTMASGFAILEVTATPYISRLGDPDHASSRLSLAAAIGSVGATIGPYLGSAFLLHDQDISANLIASLNPQQLQNFLNGEAHMVIAPYLTLAGLFIALCILLYFLNFPVINEGVSNKKLSDVFKFKHTMLGVFAVFAYLGAEVGVVSFIIRYTKTLNIVGMTEKKAALFITLYMALVLAGRLLGALILKHNKPNKVLIICSTGAFGLVLVSVLTSGYLSIITLSIVGFFTSVMYPIIFTLSIKNIGGYTKVASSLLIMGVVGGAIIPPVMGLISDHAGIRLAFTAPLICYLYVLFYGLKGYVVKHAPLADDIDEAIITVAGH
ncbi:FHS family L-fucose permease-like MFS transporter [Mucilaginibacter oryzae]|uniref:FHS family L-fucose permease-like MFS transporter n=1 Tax=Mucilaginibacter oryzae TaxID=468058 RepID=A0A316HJ28_9SPHI|nr:L-fucose:H+ symporter permease [Mucilaginibacter oryzae]PWK80031.1 FHS family L-fucose permease-like MFS transporter [Mucilaginibacter oryzae]